MSILLPVLIALFFACVLGQLVLVKRVREALARRHPDVWRRLSTQTLFVDSAVSTFARRRDDRNLNDADLSKRAAQLRFVANSGIVIWFVLAGLLTVGGMQRR